MFRQPLFHLLNRVQVGQIFQLMQQLIFRERIHTNCLLHQLQIQLNTPVVDGLVKGILLPDKIRHGEPSNFLFNRLFRFHIPLVVCPKDVPFLWSIGRSMKHRNAVYMVIRHTEVANQSFPLGHFLLL